MVAYLQVKEKLSCGEKIRDTDEKRNQIETRALQAKAFNDVESGFDVLVASDAVGMGLNLNIKRIIFTTVEKFDGKTFKRVSIPQMKQIAGRAGRFGTAYSDGEVTT